MVFSSAFGYRLIKKDVSFPNLKRAVWFFEDLKKIENRAFKQPDD